jgi:hypothetical protein
MHLRSDYRDQNSGTSTFARKLTIESLAHPDLTASFYHPNLNFFLLFFLLCSEFESLGSITFWTSQVRICILFRDLDPSIYV